MRRLLHALVLSVVPACFSSCDAACIEDCRGQTDLLSVCIGEMSCNIDGVMLRRCTAGKSGAGTVPCAVPLERGAVLSTSIDNLRRNRDDEVLIAVADAADLVDLRVAVDSHEVSCQRVEINLVCGPIGAPDRTLTITNGRASPLLLLGLSLRSRRRACGDRVDSCPR